MKRGARACAAAAAAGVLLVGVVGCGTGRGTAGVAGPGVPPPQALPQASGTPAECHDAKASLRPPASVPAPGTWAADSFMARIAKNGTLRVGVDQSTFPFGYLDPADGQMHGFDDDLLRLVAKAIFPDADTNPSRITFTVLQNDDRVDAVDEDRVDIVAMTMTVNCDRRTKNTIPKGNPPAEFSAVYFNTGQRVLVQKNTVPFPERGLAGMAGLRVCSVRGSTSLDRLNDPAIAPGVVPVIGETWADCLVRLQKGQVEGVTTDATILAGLNRQDPLFTEVVGPTIGEEPYAMAIRATHPEFVRFVNAVLVKAFADETWKQLYDKHIADSLGTAHPDPPNLDWQPEK
ncbi:transporter substrate-binding domain-containing protein [Yinghuangia seranimata]|uniref:transporter substrate-binding domain-containing protein n=1 Tax=Yinghuangia seranimata TaxID=408067 RepID=UPI00248AB0BF|nr:transporter substrate-binding domain-containing protein [Yinghuangia seranimata]MDI2125191.1 transporter substrate-binding domain-containing protein [Yinghuangia seranimata]